MHGEVCSYANDSLLQSLFSLLNQLFVSSSVLVYKRISGCRMELSNATKVVRFTKASRIILHSQRDSLSRTETMYVLLAVKNSVLNHGRNGLSQWLRGKKSKFKKDVSGNS
jgi:hypothetical protein